MDNSAHVTSKWRAEWVAPRDARNISSISTLQDRADLQKVFAQKDTGSSFYFPDEV